MPVKRKKRIKLPVKKYEDKHWEEWDRQRKEIARMRVSGL